MAKILLVNGEELNVTLVQALKYISECTMSEVHGFKGDEDWIPKLAHYAGERKFGRDNAETKDLVTSKKSLNDYLYEKGKLTAYQHNQLKGQ